MHPGRNVTLANMTAFPNPAHMGSVDKGTTRFQGVSLQGPDNNVVASAVSRLLTIDPTTTGKPLDIRWENSADWPGIDDDESYTLAIDEKGATLTASHQRGILHGLVTLAQLQTPDGFPHCQIADRPRFPWRGLMLDPARRFLPIALLEQVLDGMAWLKLNVLHLHLSDDQGFRFRSSHYPNLASPDAYSADELRQLVTYAAGRGIRIVPELDMPGHVTSWLTACPEWGAGEAKPTRRFGVHPGCLNPADERVYDAIRNLLAEVAEVFPDPYLHIGGDEVHSRWWEENTDIRAFIAANGLADSGALQAYFNRRVDAIVRELGKRTLGWDEVLHADMPRGITVQAWRGATARDRALAAGCDCIVSSGFYLDLFYPADVHGRYDPALAEADLVAQEDALLTDHRFAHVAEGMRWTHAWRQVTELPPAPACGRVLGGEACLWGELVDAACLPSRLWSRLPAVAELLWSAPESIPDADMPARWPRFIHERLAEQRTHLASLVGNDLLPLVELCEPVKWYARLLGDMALAARIEGREMPQARPYTLDTPLNRVVDFLLPESLALRAIAALDDDALRHWCARLIGNTTKAALPADIQGVIGALREGLGIALDALNGQLSREDARQRLMERYRPCGEYMPAALLTLAKRLT
ncbi:MAG: family 20 glycosylhydrolase [Pseudomonadales bacterium]